MFALFLFKLGFARPLFFLGFFYSRTAGYHPFLILSVLVLASIHDQSKAPKTIDGNCLQLQWSPTVFTDANDRYVNVGGANIICGIHSMFQRTACGKIVETGGALIGQIKLWSHQKPTPICDYNSFLAFLPVDLGDKVAKVDRGAPSSKLKISPQRNVCPAPAG